MHIEDAFILISGQLLKATPLEYADKKTSLAKFISQYELERPQHLHAFSIAGQMPSGENEGFWVWLEALRSEGARLTQILYPKSEAGLPQHVAAAFANGIPKVVEFTSRSQVYQFAPQIMYSRSTWITGPDLEMLFDSQFSDARLRDELWNEIYVKDVRRFGEYMESVDPSDARKFLRNDYERHFCPANDLLRTAQHFCARRGQDFKIPESLKLKLVKHANFEDPLFGDPYAPYFSGKPQAADLAAWVDAQADSASKWKKMAEDLSSFLDPSSKLGAVFSTSLSADSIRDGFLKLSEEDLYQLPIGNIALALGPNFVIPEALKDKFTYPERPPIPDNQLWGAVDNPETWQMLLFQLLHQSKPESFLAPHPSVEVSSFTEALPEFRLAVKEIAEFAKRHNSVFQEPFRLALWVLDHPEAPLTAAKLQSEGFSETAIRVTAQSFTSGLLEALQLPPSVVRVGLALELVDQFGGMGSWNDQGFESGADQDQYEKVSRQMYEQIVKLRSLLFY